VRTGGDQRDGGGKERDGGGKGWRREGRERMGPLVTEEMIEDSWSERAKRDSTVGVQDESPVPEGKMILK